MPGNSPGLSGRRILVLGGLLETQLVLEVHRGVLLRSEQVLLGQGTSLRRGAHHYGGLLGEGRVGSWHAVSVAVLAPLANAEVGARNP